MIKAVIFDMDGLIIDSEPFWRRAEIKVFSTVGIKLTESDCIKTIGYRIDEVVEFWYKQFPWHNKSKKQIEEEIVTEVINEVNISGKPLPGVIETIKKLHNQNIPLAIASSSALKIINAVVHKLELNNYFDLYHSAEFEDFGKPHPQVFISTAKKLGIAPEECLVFEDSPSGVIAGIAAKMRVIAIPEEANKNDKRILAANEVLKSISDFSMDKYIK